MRIYIIGFMGCGKSTVGKKLAAKINYRFIDLDKYIEAIKYFDNIIEIDPKNLEAKKNKERCYYRCYKKRYT
ncbi:MAG: shikimate kinase, partial [Bacteroidota bacterium]|nr:shikimate kinase [Bacteroidota bacterium]